MTSLSLNEIQHQAVTNINSNLLILAGAGTGKTRVLTEKFVYLIEHANIHSSEILAVTFTNKAANEMRKRILSMTNSTMSVPYIGTFHSISAKILRDYAASHLNYENNFQIIDGDDQMQLIKTISHENGVERRNTKMHRMILSQISNWKSECEVSNFDKLHVPYILREIPIVKIYKTYQKILLQSNLMDFDDLICNLIILLRDNKNILEMFQERFRYILVDEYQDTNTAQYMLLKLLYKKGTNKICCVGDDDQAIYSWRGAKVDNILQFTENFDNSQVIRLEQNYRSTPIILEAASAVVANNSRRLGKKLWCDANKKKFQKISVIGSENDESEAYELYSIAQNYLSKDDTNNTIAILVRAIYQTRSIEEIFNKMAVPYKVVGSLRFYDRMEVKDLLSYMRLVNNINDDIAFTRIINKPRRGIGDRTLDKMNMIAVQNSVSLFKACEIAIGECQINSSTASKIQSFLSLILNLREMSSNMSMGELLSKIFDETKYIEFLKEDDSINAESRISNIKELQKFAYEFTDLTAFLEHVSLVNSINDSESEGKFIPIMTIHSAKGLEFDEVVLPGWEEGTFPSRLSIQENDRLEEERRLAYVSITRARKKLFILYKHQIRQFEGGFYNLTQPSRFLLEIPKNLMKFLGDTHHAFENDFYYENAFGENGNEYGPNYSNQYDGQTNNQYSREYRKQSGKKYFQDSLNRYEENKTYSASSKSVQSAFSSDSSNYKKNITSSKKSMPSLDAYVTKQNNIETKEESFEFQDISSDELKKRSKSLNKRDVVSKLKQNAVGRVVTHEVFGRGVISKIVNQDTVEIIFSNYGKKKIQKNFIEFA